MEAQYSADYFLSIGHKKSWRVDYFSILIFWFALSDKMGVAVMRVPKGLGLAHFTKKPGQLVALLDQFLTRNHAFEIFRAKHPSSLYN